MKRTALIILLLSALTTNGISQTKRINMSKAVQLAEEFVIKNGYTDLPPSKDKREIKRESLEGSSSIDVILMDRRNTLERRAYGAKYFQYGENIKMQHQDFFLNAVERLSRN
jgi:hypothetical protein